MNSGGKRVLALLFLTAGYWLMALMFLGLTLSPECLTNVSVCEASKRSSAALVIGVEWALYMLLLFAVSRQRSSTRWILLVLMIALIAGFYTGFA